MGFLHVQLVLGVPDRLVVPDRVSLVQLKRLLDDTSASQWSYLHQVSQRIQPKIANSELILMRFRNLTMSMSKFTKCFFKKNLLVDTGTVPVFSLLMTK
jgi:hypothetical protein